MNSYSFIKGRYAYFIVQFSDFSCLIDDNFL